jgi:hypothetical protein
MFQSPARFADEQCENENNQTNLYEVVVAATEKKEEKLHMVSKRDFGARKCFTSTCDPISEHSAGVSQTFSRSRRW